MYENNNNIIFFKNVCLFGRKYRLVLMKLLISSVAAVALRATIILDISRQFIVFDTLLSFFTDNERRYSIENLIIPGRINYKIKKNILSLKYRLLLLFNLKCKI